MINLKNVLFHHILFDLNHNLLPFPEVQRKAQYLEWLNSTVITVTEEFISQNNLIASDFVKGLNSIFKTSRFEVFLKRWTLEYILKLFNRLQDIEVFCPDGIAELSLWDIPINRFGVSKYFQQFGVTVRVCWLKKPGMFRALFILAPQIFIILYLSLNRGFKLNGRKRNFKVMRECLWGLNKRGFYYHDDFLVDGDKVKKDDLLLFARSYIKKSPDRLDAFKEAEQSRYHCCSLGALKIGKMVFIKRVLLKYIYKYVSLILSSMHSEHFIYFTSIYTYFITFALPYEKIFSNFNVASELAHTYFSVSHIPEAIVCENYRARYCFMQWSDYSLNLDIYTQSFMGAHYFLLWGRSHLHGKEGGYCDIKFIGFVFKKFINDVMANRQKVLSLMQIVPSGRIISFFDESFGGEVKMNEGHFVNFWELALISANRYPLDTIVIKPKSISYLDRLSVANARRLKNILDNLKRCPNVHILDPIKWTFIEAIGISDIVINQGMASSAGIALMCGVDALYYDEAHHDHIFSRATDLGLVFDNPGALLARVDEILNSVNRPTKIIPEDIMRGFEDHSDNNGIDRLRDILLGITS